MSPGRISFGVIVLDKVCQEDDGGRGVLMSLASRLGEEDGERSEQTNGKEDTCG